ncbi:3-hydroxyacyl-CoA dehydrogenase NAD-binding domain-containing protein [Citricoccus sp. NR2]|uniref:3-hydroxyacyl-CoA dehydrogenase NAD-binding domain-containing protein n=1 Tax=Citricoccus sp. NR2 TaxID=3004095 RepID=UPI0022DE11F4|nr:3-hydroxyacyl-CoA dehydrogenase NAD-binding domain-containing protein [Citricoccus sp. NR2]WBL18168.1 3-hydroxyacyl-CoA dehydrogenase NAD-binding domain-containing protein [Citricoccus sp. NR2]
MPTENTDRFSEFEYVAAEFADEIITHSVVTDIELPENLGRLALITLDNNAGPKRPTTLGPGTLIEFGRAVDAQAERARAGEIVALALIGKPGFLVAGADLGSMKSVSDPKLGEAMAELGHAAYDGLLDFPVPTFAFINGLALGGGLEIALACQYRTVSTHAKALGLPEAYLGLVPGWGGVFQTPYLLGPENALTVMIKNPLNNNRTLNGKAAYEIGLADALFDGGDDPSTTAPFLDASVAWATRVLQQDAETIEALNSHRDHDFSPEAWDRALAEGRAIVEAKTGGYVPAPAEVMDLFEAARTSTRKESAKAQCAALSKLIASHEFANTVYAFLDVVQKRSKRPAGAPDPQLARPLKKVGVVGAGLMAGQLAQVFATHLKVPVVMTDLDQERVNRGVAAVRANFEKLAAKGRISASDAEQLASLISGSVSQDVFSDADFVIEAIFEEIELKKKVLRQLETIVSPECILASNTSSLSITEMSSALEHPERMIGFHFFNPVAVMPLVELVRGPETTEEVLATGFATAQKLRKTAVLVHDAPAFVVNRILLRMMGEVQNSFDEGTDAHTADHALDPMALPMTPFTLLAMVGLPVAQHVTESLNTAFGDERFPVSPNIQRLIDGQKTAIWAKDDASSDDKTETIPAETMDLMSFGDSPQSAEELLTRVQDALAEEIGLMLDEGVVADPEDIDLCMITGAGWPLHLGGITPYLDQAGASERVNGRTFH